MENQSISQNCVALFLQGECEISQQRAEQLVRRAIREKELEPWSRIHIDLFCTGRDCLVIAFPESEPSVEIADYAIEYIYRYFTN